MKNIIGFAWYTEDALHALLRQEIELGLLILLILLRRILMHYRTTLARRKGVPIYQLWLVAEGHYQLALATKRGARNESLSPRSEHQSEVEGLSRTSTKDGCGHGGIDMSKAEKKSQKRKFYEELREKRETHRARRREKYLRRQLARERRKS